MQHRRLAEPRRLRLRLRRTGWSAFTAVTLGLAAPGCSDDGAGDGSTGEAASSGPDDDDNATIPVTSVSSTLTTTTGDATDSTTAEVTSSGPETQGETTDDPSSGTTSTDGTTGTESGTAETTSGTTGETVLEVEWCILQFPATIETAPKVATTTYARVFVEGITDLSPMNDVDALLVSEFGHGLDGSDPAMGGWTWIAGTPNPGWDGSMAPGGGDQTNNDEYQADLSFPAAGSYDYAARFSADGGTTWAYCDLDDLVTGGYSPDQAGSATITN